MSDPLDITDIKSYLFAHLEKSPILENILPIQRNELCGLTDDQAFQLVVAMLAAEESAEIIGTSLRRTVMLTRQPTTVLPSAVSTDDAGVIKRELIWVSRRFDPRDLISKTVTGSRQYLDVTGPGRITDLYMIAPSSSIGLNLIVDGEAMYYGSYAELQAQTKADSKMAVYGDTITGNYVIKLSQIGFLSSFVFSVTTTEEVTFEEIVVNYELLVST